MRIDLRIKEPLKDGSSQIGHTVLARVVKNKVAPPFRHARFEIIFGHGISREGEILDFGEKLGILNRKGSWYQWDGQVLGQGRETARSFLKDHQDTAREIEGLIQSKNAPALRAEEETAGGLRMLKRRCAPSPAVDALVVNTRLGEQVFTLQGADTVYRMAIESISEGAITMSTEGTILYSNRCFARMLGIDLNRVIGAPIFDFATQESRGLLTALLRRESGRGEVSLLSGEVAQVPAYIATRRLELDDLVSVCAVVTDLTEQKRSEGVIRTGELIQSVLEQSPNPVIVCDASGTICSSYRAHSQTGWSFRGSKQTSAS